MSYHHHSSLGGIGSVVSAAAAIVEDPCLTDVTTSVLRLRDIAARRSPARPGQPTAPGGKGIGLCNVAKPLRAGVWLYERPWVVPVGALAIVGGIFFAGFTVGRGRR